MEQLYPHTYNLINAKYIHVYTYTCIYIYYSYVDTSDNYNYNNVIKFVNTV